jgi:hypothetical protein
MSRDILKAKLLTQGISLHDDNCMYRGKTLIARDVKVVEGDDDCIAFEFDLVDESATIGCNMIPALPSLLH